ncbi:MAG: cytochrome c [Myxococcota bacterium]
MQVKLLVFTFVLSLMLFAGVGCEKQSQTPSAESNAPSASADEAREPGPEGEPAEESKSAGPPKTLDDLPEGVNAVQNEMQLLNAAMQQILTLIANDNLEGVPAQIKTVHPARQLTMKAVEKGQYEPPVNADNMEEFEELDDQFHDDLKALIAASKKDDLQAATDSYTELVQGCTNCHTQFRFAPGEGPKPGEND